MWRSPWWRVLLLAGAVACREDAAGPVPSVDSLLVLSPTDVSLTVGASQPLSAVLVVADTDTVVVQPDWTSRDGSVASVTSAGLVTGVAQGRTHVVAAFGGAADSARVAVTGGTVQPSLRRVTAALSYPVFAVAPPGDASRLFVVEKGGVVRVLRNDSLLPAPFLDIRGDVSGGSEQGLLSMAFHPSYGANGRVYVSYTDAAGTSKVVRYRVSDPETADPATALEILSVGQPFANHNGGLITFGPDGMLYVGLGDGGSGGDPQGNAQNPGTLLGSILRIDVDGGTPYAVPPDNPFVGQQGARGEVWMYGLRNPWRFSFDRSLGDLYIGDVGQATREEIDVLAAPVAAGANFGWNIMEGFSCYNAATCSTTGLTPPVLDYPTTDGCAVVGGFVYRGGDVPLLRGRYFYSDFCGGWIRSITFVDGSVVASDEWPALSPGTGVTSFAEDGRGELYVMTAAGALYRIVPNGRGMVAPAM